jgi:hypothetical protein
VTPEQIVQMHTAHEAMQFASSWTLTLGMVMGAAICLLARRVVESRFMQSTGRDTR